jgi:hypothetical protein
MTTFNQFEDIAKLRLSDFVHLKEGAPTLVDGSRLPGEELEPLF